ncbi:MAG TPA: hypothetical protein DCM87_15805 [Planctomycetes bacterium]|nr:hypothetical protein [Planctomycetota bacterium]
MRSGASPSEQAPEFPPGDPLIDEVRERRRRLLEEHGNDLERFCRALQAFQAEHPDKVRPRGSSAQGR